jgi:hypothetical protein
MRKGSRSVLVSVGAAALVAIGLPAAAQQVDVRSLIDTQSPLIVAPPLPPATQLEGFHAPIGAVVTVGHEVLGNVRGISVEVRELRDSTGGRARGLTIEIATDNAAPHWSYIDLDEVPQLLRGIDQLLPLTSNPTQFSNFEMHYATKGELEVTASSSPNRGVVFSVEVGRLAKARKEGLTAGELQQLRTLIEAAAQRIATMATDR